MGDIEHIYPVLDDGRTRQFSTKAEALSVLIELWPKLFRQTRGLVGIYGDKVPPALITATQHRRHG